MAIWGLELARMYPRTNASRFQFELGQDPAIPDVSVLESVRQESSPILERTISK